LAPQSAQGLLNQFVILAEHQKFFVDRHFENATELKMALQKSLLLVLKSPRFGNHAHLVRAQRISWHVSQ